MATRVARIPHQCITVCVHHAGAVIWWSVGAVVGSSHLLSTERGAAKNVGDLVRVGHLGYLRCHSSGR